MDSIFFLSMCVQFTSQKNLTKIQQIVTIHSLKETLRIQVQINIEKIHWYTVTSIEILLVSASSFDAILTDSVPLLSVFCKG